MSLQKPFDIKTYPKLTRLVRLETKLEKRRNELEDLRRKANGFDKGLIELELDKVKERVSDVITSRGRLEYKKADKYISDEQKWYRRHAPPRGEYNRGTGVYPANEKLSDILYPYLDHSVFRVQAAQYITAFKNRHFPVESDVELIANIAIEMQEILNIAHSSSHDIENYKFRMPVIVKYIHFLIENYGPDKKWAVHAILKYQSDFYKKFTGDPCITDSSIKDKMKRRLNEFKGNMDYVENGALLFGRSFSPVKVPIDYRIALLGIERELGNEMFFHLFWHFCYNSVPTTAELLLIDTIKLNTLIGTNKSIKRDVRYWMAGLETYVNPDVRVRSPETVTKFLQEVSNRIRLRQKPDWLTIHYLIGDITEIIYDMNPNQILYDTRSGNNEPPVRVGQIKVILNLFAFYTKEISNRYSTMLKWLYLKIITILFQIHDIVTTGGKIISRHFDKIKGEDEFASLGVFVLAPPEEHIVPCNRRDIEGLINLLDSYFFKGSIEYIDSFFIDVGDQDSSGDEFAFYEQDADSDSESAMETTAKTSSTVICHQCGKEKKPVI